jgi:predicted TIM-barrel fold metal-dependent hydrolase
MFLAKDGVQQPGFQRLLGVLRSNRKVWVKLTGVYRMSKAPGFVDAAPMARALMETAPERLIWGSDYPHLSFADTNSSEALFATLKGWARGDEATLRRILVENPAKLFGF